MKLLPTLLAVWLAALNTLALDIALTPWKQVTYNFDSIDQAVDGVVLGRREFSFAYSDILFSLDGGLNALADSPVYRRDERVDRVQMYRGQGVFQFDTRLYRIVGGQAMKVGFACPGATGIATAINGSRLVTVAANVVCVSEDSGATWAEYLNPWGPVSGAKVSLTEVYHDGESFVGTGSSGTWRSADGTFWRKISDTAVSMTFSGELGAVVRETYLESHLSLLRGDGLEEITKIQTDFGNISTVYIAPAGFFMWGRDTLRFHGNGGTTVETAMPSRINGMLRLADQSIRVFTEDNRAWDSLPLTEPPFQEPAIASIAMVARLVVTGTPNTTVTVEGSPAANGPWESVGSVVLGSNGQATWTDSTPATRSGWFYRMSARAANAAP